NGIGHQQLITWSESDGLDKIWDVMPEGSLEEERHHYARQHYLTHLANVPNHYQELLEILEEAEFIKAAVRYDPTYYNYANQLKWSRNISRELSQLWRFNLLLGLLEKRIDFYPFEVFNMLFQQGNKRMADRLLDQFINPYQKSMVLSIYG